MRCMNLGLLLLLCKPTWGLRGTPRAGKQAVGIFEDKGMLKHIIHMLDRLDMNRACHLGRNFFQFSLIFLWHQNQLNTPASCCKELLFEATYREYPAPQGDLPGHGYIVPDRNL